MRIGARLGHEEETAATQTTASESIADVECGRESRGWLGLEFRFRFGFELR